MGAEEYLDVVDENDVVMGREVRSVIHREGLLHREVHVWFVDDSGKLIFQKREPDDDVPLSLLDATAGGHVSSGQTYVEAALTEIEEETGLRLSAEQIVPLCKIRSGKPDASRKDINIAYRMVFLYRFTEQLDKLRVEKGKGLGFVKLSLGALEENKDSLLPSLLRENYLPVWKRLEELL
jgi:isopentenyldiphosphate isomerase